jgi:hypothetical protein
MDFFFFIKKTEIMMVAMFYLLLKVALNTITLTSVIRFFFTGIGNKKTPLHFLVIHGSLKVTNPPDFKLDLVKDWFESTNSNNGRVEGVVWHCSSGVLYKVS